MFLNKNINNYHTVKFENNSAYTGIKRLYQSIFGINRDGLKVKYLWYKYLITKTSKTQASIVQIESVTSVIPFRIKLPETV